MLSALDYQLGSYTPQAFLDELFLALPSLRRLVDFRHGWGIVQKCALCFFNLAER